MRDNVAGFNICQTSVNIPKKVDLFEEGLEAVHVDENRRTSPLLGKDDRSLCLLHLPEQILSLGSEIGGGMNVFCHIERDAWHQNLRSFL